MDGERANFENNQPNESYDAWQKMAEEMQNSGGDAVDHKYQESNTVDSMASNAEQNEEYELTPEELEWREGHTDEEIDSLIIRWENWLGRESAGGISHIGKRHGNILSDIYDDKDLGWKFSDFKEFFDNSWEVDNQSPRNDEGETIGWRLGESLETLKQALGEDSPEYKTAVRKVLIDIRDGKYKGARLSFDRNYYTKIIFGDQEDEIKRDDKKRREQKEVEERKREEQARKSKESWGKSWRNPENEAEYKRNAETIDRRTFDYMNNLVYNLSEIAPAARDLVMDAINQGILEGAFNGAYLSNTGTFWTGKMAEEQKGYEQNRQKNGSGENEPPVLPIEKPNSGGRRESEIKSPEDFGFRDWRN